MNAIENAVMPLKADAIANARQYAEKLVASTLAGLEECGWDLRIYAPYPDGYNTRQTYREKLNKRNRALALCKHVKTCGLRMNEPDILVKDDASIDVFYNIVESDAAAEYDAFVAKLVSKVGDVTDAELSGNHVWGHSVLTVTKPDGSVERWKTQTIVNVSSLGKLFNQFPTRKMK